MADNLVEWGRPSMKSFEMSSQTLLGIGNGCNSLARVCVSYLLCWQVSHCWINAVMFDFIRTQKKFANNLLYVRKFPECPPTRVLWSSWMTCCLCWDIDGSTSLPLCHSGPSFIVKLAAKGSLRATASLVAAKFGWLRASSWITST